MKSCIVADCGGRHMAQGFCDKHYRRLLRHGSPHVRSVRRNLTLDERFFARVHITSDCWIWTGSINRLGYGKLTVGSAGASTTLSAHRVAFEQIVGPIPPNHEIHHRCRNRMCVRPEHLQAVTRTEHAAIEAALRKALSVDERAGCAA